MVYIDRLFHLTDFKLNNGNLHKLLLTVLRVATKFHNDKYLNNNEQYSRITGVSCEELVQLEASLMALLDYRLTIETAYFWEIQTRLCNYKQH